MKTLVDTEKARKEHKDTIFEVFALAGLCLSLTLSLFDMTTDLILLQFALFF